MKFSHQRLGVNIDHVATVRNARGTLSPDPLEACYAVINGGAEQLTIHLREDRRHINDRDVEMIRKIVSVPLNLEMAVTSEMLEIAIRIRPEMVTLVPEKRQERTTEGGLNLKSQGSFLKEVIDQLKNMEIAVSLFVEPSEKVISECAELGVSMIEIHTGTYAEAAQGSPKQLMELNRVQNAVEFATRMGLQAHVGHGLNYVNTAAIAAIPNVCDLNIGHAIVSRALFVGLEVAVREMAAIIRRASKK